LVSAEYKQNPGEWNGDASAVIVVGRYIVGRRRRGWV